MTYAKRGRTRAIPLEQEALDAIAAWVRGRPAAATAHLLLSLPRTGKPAVALTTRDVARFVERHARAAGWTGIGARRTSLGQATDPAAVRDGVRHGVLEALGSPRRPAACRTCAPDAAA